MTLENELKKVLLGDDHLDYAIAEYERMCQSQPQLRVGTIVFQDTPQRMIQSITQAETTDPYTLIISDYDYGADHISGAELFHYLREHAIGTNARKVLWTGIARDLNVQQEALELGVELFDKYQLPNIFCLHTQEPSGTYNNSVLIYCPNNQQAILQATRNVVNVLFDQELVRVGGDLKEELTKKAYGLIIDISTLCRKPGSVGVVEHDIPYLSLPNPPRIQNMYSASTLVADIARIIAEHQRQEC
jgi:hypothetical protein